MIEDILGVDLGGTKMHCLISHNGVLTEDKWATGPDCTSETIRNRLYSFLDRLDFNPKAIGMAIPGGVNREGTAITVTDSLPMTCYTPASYFTRDGIPIILVGDMHAAILSAAAPYPVTEPVAVVMMGTGVAVGYRRYDREKGQATYGGIDLGYLVYDTPDGPCFLNDIAGGYSILRAAGCTGSELAEKVNSGDPEACALIRRIGYYTGLSLSAVRLTAGAKILVLGGGASTYKGMYEAVKDTFEKTCLPLYRDGVQVLRPASPSPVGEGALIYAAETFSLSIID